MKKIVVLVLLMAMLSGCAGTPPITSENANVGKEGVYLIDWQSPISENEKVSAQVKRLDFDGTSFAILSQNFSKPSHRLFIALKKGWKYATPEYCFSYDKKSNMTTLNIRLETIKDNSSTEIQVYEIVTSIDYDTFDVEVDGKKEQIVFSVF